ncbi:2-oxo acid dehydrogenase subunit E2 [Vibrio ponticus]|uniref:Dihydrolipoamide acetyltransferase component of pyruvate dehydrogenase complex n=2 Tax=Vibrio ponticus TaxID=265668 RepID=A0A3N3DUB7_9VIBR|nr:2-oxo acid dehydrogenase subunit E2 [Vibrio ponticus]
MPALGADMQNGTLLKWQIKPGERVTKGDTLAVIETSKGAIDMESYHSGTITELLVEPEINLPVGSVIARIKSDSITNPNVSSKTTVDNEFELPPYIPPKKRLETPQQIPTNYSDLTTPDQIKPDPLPNLTSNQRVFASPVARKNAHLLGLKLSNIKGSGPQGAILLRDVPTQTSPEKSPSDVSRAAAKQMTSPSVPSSKDETTSMRHAISNAMTRSKQQIPHYYLSLEIDLTKAEHWLSEQNQQREPEQRLLLPALLLSAIARQLISYPQLNGFYRDNQFTPAQQINIANTISLRQGGIVTPAILNTDKLTLDQTMHALRDLATRSRHGRLRSSEVSQGTITVSSIGERGADSIIGVIYPPQVAIIGLGQLRQTPVVSNGAIMIGKVMTVTLAADHRVSDGITGARFLHELAKQLQHPEAL